MIKLTPLQEQWLAALESGQHKQARGLLTDGVGYCCLGLAEHVCFNRQFRPATHDCDGTGDRDEIVIGELIVSLEDEDRSKTMLVSDSAALGLREKNGLLAANTPNADQDAFYQAIMKAGYRGSFAPNLAGYNDRGATFAQIAAAIRAVPDAVFVPPKAE